MIIVWTIFSLNFRKIWIWFIQVHLFIISWVFINLFRVNLKFFRRRLAKMLKSMSLGFISYVTWNIFFWDYLFLRGFFWNFLPNFWNCVFLLNWVAWALKNIFIFTDRYLIKKSFIFGYIFVIHKIIGNLVFLDLKMSSLFV